MWSPWKRELFHLSSCFMTLQSRSIVPLALLAIISFLLALHQFVRLHTLPPNRTNALSLEIHPLRPETNPQIIHQANEPPTAPPVPPPTPAPLSIVNGRRTMVFIVNFQDSKRCAETLESLFVNVMYPDLIRVSIHDQIFQDKGDLTCVDAYCQLVGNSVCRRTQIHSTAIDANDAAGPTVARAITEKALGDEDFCLGLDSHMVFVPNWDELIIGNWEATNNENAILTVYPKSTAYLTDHSKDHQMGVQCRGNIESDDADAMVQYQAVRWFDKTNTTTPRLQAQFAGGFNFGSCRSYKDVPNDPYTPILFYGEEYARATRLWTWGYDFYAPSVDVVYHWFEPRKRIWEFDWVKRYPLMQRSKRRVRFMMGLPVSSEDFDHEELDKYGLGTKRTLAQWKEFSGIDPTANYTKDPNQFVNCGILELVPYNK